MIEAVESTEWMCGVCRWVYSAAARDPTGNINPGTLFEDMPIDWVCPVCKASKDNFFDV